ncbi:MAG: response regulator transcription factor [Deltaproteobacteria bacterium]|nr:response regulator transcription factor [Deltaproteobacteria bacterium]
MVEDEKDISELLCVHLKREGHNVVSVDNGEQALKLLDGGTVFQVLILDWMLPGLSGLDICKKLRMDRTQARQVPILMVTARTHPSDIVLGLEMGADDYLTKPFEIPIFLARVHALLRRSAMNKSSLKQGKVQIGELVVDDEKYLARCGQEELVLTPSEFKLLLALMKNEGRVLTREQLISLVQGEGVAVVDRSIDTHVFGLRKKLGRCAAVIETIRGVGYRVRQSSSHGE